MTAHFSSSRSYRALLIIAIAASLVVPLSAGVDIRPPLPANVSRAHQFQPAGPSGSIAAIPRPSQRATGSHVGGSSSADVSAIVDRLAVERLVDEQVPEGQAVDEGSPSADRPPSLPATAIETVADGHGANGRPALNLKRPFANLVAGLPSKTVQRLAPGVVHAVETRPSQRIHIAAVDLKRHRLEVSPEGAGAAVVGSWASSVGGVVAVNGNWFGPWDGPAVSDGVAYGGVDHAYTALFGVTASGKVVVDHHRFEPPVPRVVANGRPTVDERVVEGVSGHPTLVHKNVVTQDFGGDPTFLARHPRTAIGVDGSGTVLLLVVVDGRSSTAAGMTGAETAALMAELGAAEAVMLDGGGSSTMWTTEHGVVNAPSGGLQAVGNQVTVVPITP